MKSPLLRAIERARPQESYPELYGPPVRDPEIGAVLVSRYADAVQVLKDPHTFSNRMNLSPIMFEPTSEAQAVMSELLDYPQVLVIMDGEEHRRARELAARAFPRTGRDVAPFLPDLLDELIDDLWRSRRGDGPAGGEVDLMDRLVWPLVLEVTIRTVGLSTSARGMRALAKGQSQMIWGNPAPECQVAFAQDTMGIWRHCQEAVDALDAMEPEARPDNYITRLLRQGMPLDEVRANVFGVTSASYSTTPFALGNVIEDTLRLPGAWQRLHDHPSEIPHAVTQGLSTSTPVFGWLRQVRGDGEGAVVGGVTLAPGERLLVLLGAANQDTERPDDAPDLTFSTQPHRCLGASQAQYVMEKALERLTAQIPEMSLAREPRHYVDLSFYGPDELWVTLQP